MSDHEDASDESRDACEALLQSLRMRIMKLEVERTKRWCGLYETGRKRFAYVTHRKRSPRIEIWCLGRPEELAGRTRLTVRRRTPTTGGFGRDFQARVFVDNLEEIEAAAVLLLEVSYPLS